jgi:hypothetical protein
VRPENSARLGPLDKPDVISENTELIVLEGRDAAIKIDGQFMKNVILKNMHIVYEGGPVALENVTFVNCIFDFGPGDKSQELGRQILASTAVTFKSIT